MMDYSKLPKLNVAGLVVTIVIGILVAVGVYQAQVKGLLPITNRNLSTSVTSQPQVVTPEENLL